MKNYCQTCKGVDMPLVKNSVSTSGRTCWICRECINKRMRKYYATKKGGKNAREATYRSIKKYSEKQSARKKLHVAIIKGDIVRPTTCSQCPTTGRIHGHHTDYLKPLEVLWLCSGCHADIHRTL